MTKDEWLHIRIESGLKERIEKSAKENGYDDTASFIRDVLKKEVDPKLDRDILAEKIRLVLREDPTLLDDPLRRIGIRFYAQKSDDQ
ncbi:MAG: hypothetical protein M0Q91_16280 [Methanoregula sp.]|jgi:hypothetical protein|nr:hypothetical protein [Methanoregula sp.]